MPGGRFRVRCSEIYENMHRCRMSVSRSHRPLHYSVPNGLYVDTIAVADEVHESGPSGSGLADPARTGRPAPERIVFIHGAMDRCTSFARVRSRFATSETVAYDRRGYAQSVGLGPAQTFQDHVSDLRAVVGNRRSVLVGHSYGGNVCLALAAEEPDLVEAMVVFEAPMSWEPWWPTTAGGSTIAVGEEHGPEAAAESFMRRIVGADVWEGLSDPTKAARRAEGHALLFDLTGLRGRGSPYDPLSVRVPTVVGHGELSLAHQIRSSVELHARLVNAPRLLRALPGSRHGAHSANPAGLAALVIEAVDLAHAP